MDHLRNHPMSMSDEMSMNSDKSVLKRHSYPYLLCGVVLSMVIALSVAFLAALVWKGAPPCIVWGGFAGLIATTLASFWVFWRCPSSSRAIKIVCLVLFLFNTVETIGCMWSVCSGALKKRNELDRPTKAREVP